MIAMIKDMSSYKIDVELSKCRDACNICKRKSMKTDCETCDVYKDSILLESIKLSNKGDNNE